MPSCIGTVRARTQMLISQSVTIWRRRVELLLYCPYIYIYIYIYLNRLNAELNPICHLRALLGAHYILHVSRIRVNDVKRGNYVSVPFA